MSTTNPYPDFSNYTFEKVWAMFQESHKEFQEMREQFKESGKWFLETEKIVQANAQAITRLEQSIEETTTRLAKTIAGTDKSIDRLEKSVDVTDKSIRRLEKSVENSNKEHGSLGNRFGEVIEHLITPGVMPRFNALGYHFTKASTRVKIVDPITNKTITEMDIVLENGDAIIVVEIKVDPSLSDVKKHIRRLQIFREDRDKSSPNDGKKIFGAIAAAVFPKEVQEAALQAGFYVIVQGGDTITIDVPEGFEPTAF